ncbi:MAG: hypothetical protein ACTSUQ_05030 [Candidatus Freyarchaeota archaeon]
MFEGALGSGAKSVAYNVILKVISDSGVLDSFEGKMEDLYEALSNYLEMSAAINLAVSQKIRKDSESAVLVNIISCPFKDTCEVANREGITSVTGGTGLHSANIEHRSPKQNHWQSSRLHS